MFTGLEMHIPFFNAKRAWLLWLETSRIGVGVRHSLHTPPIIPARFTNTSSASAQFPSRFGSESFATFNTMMRKTDN